MSCDTRKTHICTRFPKTPSCSCCSELSSLSRTWGKTLPQQYTIWQSIMYGAMNSHWQWTRIPPLHSHHKYSQFSVQILYIKENSCSLTRASTSIVLVGLQWAQYMHSLLVFSSSSVGMFPIFHIYSQKMALHDFKNIVQFLNYGTSFMMAFGSGHRIIEL